MATMLYISATNEQSGKSAITLGLMQLLIGRVGKIGFFRPIINDAATLDPEFNLINTYFNLNLPKDSYYACSLDEARRLINSGQTDTLMNTILDAYDRLVGQYDFILCQGTDFLGKNSSFELELNAQIAATLGSPVILVHPAIGRKMGETQAAASSAVEIFQQKGVDVVSLFINRAEYEESQLQEIIQELNKHFVGTTAPIIHVIPENNILARRSMHTVAKNLNATVLYGENNLIDYHVDDYLIAAMLIGNFLNFIQEGHLIITPGDREDILLGSVVATLSKAYPTIAGILITGGITPSPSIKKLLDGMRNMTVPILSVQTNTSETIAMLSSLRERIDPQDTRKIHTALGLFDRYVNVEELSTLIVDKSSSKMTPRMFEYTLMEQARKQRMRIVLPEGSEERILRAAEVLQTRRTAHIILLGDEDSIESKATRLGINLKGITIINPATSPHREEYATTYVELRKKKGISLEDARDRMLDVTYFGTMMVHLDQADGLVSGAINTTANTVRPALEFIKTKPGFSIVSSIFLMCLKDRVLAFGDCAINPAPSAEELADIAITAAHTSQLFGIEPRVAMLSYSTGTSGKGEDVDKVIEATRLAKERAPDLLLEGPLQYDAAIDPDVAKTKMPDNPVAGNATVFIFPDLNTGNNTYKAVQRAADAIAIGPVLQGLRKPVNDLSRGCSVHDIINTVAITAIQAQAEKNIKAKPA